MVMQYLNRRATDISTVQCGCAYIGGHEIHIARLALILLKGGNLFMNRATSEQ